MKCSAAARSCRGTSPRRSSTPRGVRRNASGSSTGPSNSRRSFTTPKAVIFRAPASMPCWATRRGRCSAATAAPAAAAAAQLTAFTRASGVYSLQSDGHANLYQLFLERALSLVRPGGRVGIVLPSGFASDHGCAALRRQVLDRTRIDTFISIENRDGLFPIHRGLKFLLIAATSGQATPTLPCRFGIRSPDVLDELPDSGVDLSSRADPAVPCRAADRRLSSRSRSSGHATMSRSRRGSRSRFPRSAIRPDGMPRSDGSSTRQRTERTSSPAGAARPRTCRSSKAS